MVKIFRLEDELSERDDCAVLTLQATRGDDAAMDAIDEYVDRSTHAGRSFDLEFFLNAIPDLRVRPAVLDIAIEYAINDLVQHDMEAPDAVELLQSNYPDLADNIAIAGALSSLIDESAANTLLEQDPPLSVGPIENDGSRRYQLVEQCGSGSSGSTYLATDRRLTDELGTTSVALKLMHLDGYSSGIQNAVLAEANRAGSVSHPNVIRVFDRGVADSQWAYVAMEHSSIGTLENWKPPGLRSLVRCIRDVAQGLHAVHSAGIVHADIKPANILLFGDADSSKRVVPKLADFGISRVLHSGLEEIALPSGGGKRYGNLAFMAPEVFDGTSRHSIQSDLYSLALMLRYMITGELAHSDRLEKSSSANVDAIKNRIPPRLRGLLDLAAHPERSKRPNSAAEFANLLDAWLSNASTVHDSVIRKVHLWTLRHPAMAAAACIIFLAAPPVGIGYADARDGWAFQRGRQEAQSEALSWYRTIAPAFSERSSVYDLAGRLVIHKLIEDEDALSWIFDDELTVDDRIGVLSAELASVNPTSFDALLLREQVIIHQLQSRSIYADTRQLIDTQSEALERAGLLQSVEHEQILVLRAIVSTKDAVIAISNDEPWVADDLSEQLNYLVAFLSSRKDPMTGTLSTTSKRDPRVRLAARAAEWLSSPKLLDDEPVHEWLQQEYQSTGR